MSTILPSDQAATLRNYAKHRESGHRPPVFAIASGKGGVGKTVLSVNLALRLAKSGTRVLLVDLDPGLANIDVHLRLSPRYTVHDLLEDRCKAEEAVLVAAGGLLLVPGGSLSSTYGSDAPESARQEEPRRILSKLTPLFPHVDVILLDTGAGLGPWVRGALDIADERIVVTQPDPASVTDAYALLKMLRGSHADARPELLINRVRDRGEAMLTATRIRGVAKRFLGFEPELLGWLREATAVTFSIRNQTPFANELKDSHPAMQDLSGIVAKLLAKLGTGQKRSRQASL
ncbi:MAG: ATPase [Planctomycetota bacterium]|nr:MAG: ATPase [Planctomycetota bacterium]